MAIHVLLVGPSQSALGQVAGLFAQQIRNNNPSTSVDRSIRRHTGNPEIDSSNRVRQKIVRPVKVINLDSHKNDNNLVFSAV